MMDLKEISKLSVEEQIDLLKLLWADINLQQSKGLLTKDEENSWGRIKSKIKERSSYLKNFTTKKDDFL